MDALGGGRAFVRVGGPGLPGPSLEMGRAGPAWRDAVGGRGMGWKGEGVGVGVGGGGGAGEMEVGELGLPLSSVMIRGDSG